MLYLLFLKNAHSQYTIYKVRVKQTISNILQPWSSLHDDGKTTIWKMNIYNS